MERHLKLVDPAGQDEEQKLPRLQDKVQGSPEDAREIRSMGCSLWLVNRLKAALSAFRKRCSAAELEVG